MAFNQTAMKSWIKDALDRLYIALSYATLNSSSRAMAAKTELQKIITSLEEIVKKED